MDPDVLDPVYLYFFMQTPAFMNQVWTLWTQASNTDTPPYVSLTYQRRLRCLGAPISIDYTRVADDLGQPALCHFFQLEYRRIAFRIADSRRRFDTGEAAMLTLVGTKP